MSSSKWSSCRGRVAARCASTSTSRRASISFIFRYTLCYQELRRLVAAGAIGKAYYVNVEQQGLSWFRNQRASWRTFAATTSGETRLTETREQVGQSTARPSALSPGVSSANEDGKTGRGRSSA